MLTTTAVFIAAGETSCSYENLTRIAGGAGPSGEKAASAKICGREGLKGEETRRPTTSTIPGGTISVIGAIGKMRESL